MADGYACLGESLLFSGDSEEARSHLKIALAMYKDYKGPENVQLDLANVLHFLGEAYSNRYRFFKWKYLEINKIVLISSNDYLATLIGWEKPVQLFQKYKPRESRLSGGGGGGGVIGLFARIII